jgi:aryl-alcohol dehydrogenase-like predicted oxidoreductase
MRLAHAGRHTYHHTSTDMPCEHNRCTLRSYEDSLQRLGMNHIDVLVIHDLDSMHFPPSGIAHHMGQCAGMLEACLRVS